VLQPIRSSIPLLPRRAVVGVAAVAVLLAGCTPEAPDRPLDERLSQVEAGGRATPLSELTGFRWDEVHLFNEGTPEDVIENVVGAPVIGTGEHEHGSLLVFERDGKVVEKIELATDRLRGDEYTYGADVLVTPWGHGAMRLTPPGRDAPHAAG
jgi:hypothetical protein